MIRSSSYRNKHTLIDTLYPNRTVSAELGLNLEQLELILREAIKLYSDDEELIEMAMIHSQNVQTALENERRLSVDQVDQIATVLETFVSCSTEAPSTLVAHVHTKIGLLQLLQENFNSAINHLLKALWIRNNAQESADRLALASHRLGLAYGMSSNFFQATSLLEKAIQCYDEAHVPASHHLVLSAKQSHQKYQGRRQSLMLSQHQQSHHNQHHHHHNRQQHGRREMAQSRPKHLSQVNIAVSELDMY